MISIHPMKSIQSYNRTACGQKFEKVENEENVNFVISLSKYFKCEFNTPHIVKFDSGLILFSSFFSFQLTFMTKKSVCVFLTILSKKSG